MDENNLFKKADMILKFTKTGIWEWKATLDLPCKVISVGNSLLASGNKVLFDLVWLLTSILGSTNYKQLVIFLFGNTRTFHNSNSMNETLSPSPDA